MNEFFASTILIGTGGFFAFHCSRVTVRELRSGRALGGRWGDYDRNISPTGFWLLMAVNAAAAVMGLGFVIAGSFVLLDVIGVLK